MHSNLFLKSFLLTSSALFWAISWSFIQAQEIRASGEHGFGSHQQEQIFYLVQNTDTQDEVTTPSGTLILPDSLAPINNEEKKCMTVCARWGEDCAYINRGVGGTTRSCRRTCQQFTEECF